MRRTGPRVTSACRYCKQRRAKCDGVRPACSRCEQLSRECVYDGVDHRKARHTHDEFKALHNRVSYLEEQLRLLAETKSPLVDNTRNRVQDTARSGVEWEPLPTSDAESAFISTPFMTHWEELFSWDSMDLRDDWIVDLSPLPWDNDKRSLVRSLFSKKGSELQFDQGSGRTVYVGPTSNHHLMTATSSLGGRVPSEVGSHRVTTLGRHEVVLLRTFQERIHGTFPIIHDDIAAEPQQLMHEVVAQPLLLCIVLATAAFVLDEDVLARWSVSRENMVNHYRRKFTARVGPELENCCLQNVKAFLLKAYLDSLCGELESATVCNSIASAMAKRLGLHVDCTIDRSSGSLSGNSSKRLSIFWATLWLDRRLAVLEGRTCHIDHVDISSPRPLHLLRSRDPSLELPLSLELVFACQVEFSWMQDIALNKLYTFADHISKEDAISESHLKFISWFGSLPASMKDLHDRKAFHPSFLAFHLSFHPGLILLHRRFLDDNGQAAELSNRRCEESAAAITGLLKTYHEYFPEFLVDPMVLHAAFTSALVHLVLLLQPDIVTYRTSLKAIRSTKQILLSFTKISPPALMILRDLRQFATKYDISPANGRNFWAAPSDELDDASSYDLAD